MNEKIEPTYIYINASERQNNIEGVNQHFGFGDKSPRYMSNNEIAQLLADQIREDEDCSRKGYFRRNDLATVYPYPVYVTIGFEDEKEIKSIGEVCDDILFLKEQVALLKSQIGIK